MRSRHTLPTRRTQEQHGGVSQRDLLAPSVGTGVADARSLGAPRARARMRRARARVPEESGLWSEVVLVPEYWPQARGRGLQAIAEEGEVDTEGGQSESRLRRRHRASPCALRQRPGAHCPCYVAGCAGVALWWRLRHGISPLGRRGVAPGDGEKMFTPSALAAAVLQRCRGGARAAR